MTGKGHWRGDAAYSGATFVNLATCQAKSISPNLPSRASGLFIFRPYDSATMANDIVGWIAGLARSRLAGNLPLVFPAFDGETVSLAARPGRMITQAA
jgi:hypothetical protein